VFKSLNQSTFGRNR